VLSALLEPFIPSFCAKLNFFLGIKERTDFDSTLIDFIS